MTGIDLELFQAYSSVGESVDRIACFQSTRKAFLNQVSMQVRHENSEDDLIWRLMQLRKAKKLKANNLGNN